MTELYQFTDKKRISYETSMLPYAIYQFANLRVNVLVVSDGLCRLMKRDRQELMELFQNDMYAGVHPEDAYPIEEAAMRFAKGQDAVFNLVYRERLSRDADYSTIHAVGEHFRTTDGVQLAIVRYDNISAAMETTAQVRSSFERSVEEFVATDSLTGLSNLAFFDQNAGEWIAQYLDVTGSAVLVFFDLVGMKLYNAQYGYEEGDKLLREVAIQLRKTFMTQLIARIDSDHFCVLSERDEIEQRVEEVAAEVALAGVSRVEIKAGILPITEKHTGSVSALIDEARMACDLIHSDADHIWRFYDEDLIRQLQDQKFVNDHLDQAIENGEIQVYYQPVVRTLDQKLCGYEALARWISPELGFLAPYRFIPVLEASHQIHKLDYYIIQQICIQYREDVDAGRPVVPVSFNLSRLDFQMCDMFSLVLNMADYHRVPHDFLRIEITETTFAEDNGVITEAIEKFQKAGFEVWMDDFGSGYSSLNSLKDYEFDQLKIDMAFLKSFTGRSRIIVTSIVQMAKNIGIHTLAEGVETEEHYEFLRSIGCEKVQGYYFGKPMPLTESLKQVTDKGVVQETSEEAGFYSKAGMFQAAIEEPFAILEHDGNRTDYLYMNHHYLEIMSKAGLKTAQHAAEAVNDNEVVQQERYRERIRQAVENGGHLRFVFPMLGHFLTVTIQILNNENGRICFMQTLSSIVMDTKPGTESVPVKKNSEDPDTPDKTILIVDDDPVSFVLMQEMLGDRYHLLFAENGEQALQLVRENKGSIAAILLDLLMPVMDGIEVLRQLRKDPLTSFIPVLAMSGEDELQPDALSIGANRFLMKPFDRPEIILAKIESEIAKTETIRGYAFKSMENMPGGLFIYRADARQEILYANQQALEIFECSSFRELMQFTGGTFRGMILPEDYESVQQQIEHQTQENDSGRDHVRYRIRTRSGTVRTIDEFGQIARDEIVGDVFFVFIAETGK